jgi:protein SCO1
MLRGFVGMPTLTMGKDYDVIAVSFDPTEKPKLAADKKENYVREYGRNNAAADSWHFLTGDEAQIKQLTQTVGFHYKYDPDSKQYIHPSGLTVLTPAGKISRYFFGIDYEPRDLRLAIDEAGQGKTGSLTEHILLYCYHYDAASGKYGLAIMSGLRVFGAVFVIGMVGGIVLMLRKDKNQVITSPVISSE